MKRIFLSLLTLAALGQAHAYQAEAGGSLNTGDYSDGLRIGGTYHLNGVDTSKGPLAEASFIDQSTFVRAGFEDSDSLVGYAYRPGSNLIGGGRYVHQESGFYADANLTLGDANGIEIGGGYYLKPMTTIGGQLVTNDFVTVFSANGKHLMTLEDGTYLNVEAGIEFGSLDFIGTDASTTRFYGEGDYYLSNTLSIGGGLSFFSTSFDSIFGPVLDDSGMEIKGNATMFIDENISLTGGASLVNADLGGSSFGINFGGAMRF